MGKPKPVKAPDPIATGAMQTGTNVATAIANQMGAMVNQNDPYGSISYDQTGTYTFTDPTSGKSYDIPRWTANQTLNATGQRLQDTNVATQQNLANIARDQSGRIGGLLGSPMDMSRVVQRQGSPNLQANIAGAGQVKNSYEIADRGRVEEALMSRMNPQLQQDRALREAQLRQQGITLGSEAYDRAMGQLDQQSTDARMQAILAGGQEQSRLTALNAGQAQFQNAAQAQQFGQNATAAGFRNSALMDAARFNEAQRAASLNEAYQQRNQPINEISALMGGSQVQAPNFVNTPALNMPTTDYAGLTQQNYANQMAGYQQQMQNWNGLWGGLMGGAANLGSAAIMASDRRVKRDIKRVGTADNGLPIYSYRYIWGGPVQIGVMAQDVAEVNPGAVADLGGFLGVDYAEAFA